MDLQRPGSSGPSRTAATGTRDRFLVDLDDAVRPLSDAEEITFTAASALGRHLGANRCAYATMDADENTFLVTGNYTDGVRSIVGRCTFRQFGEECLRLMRAGLPFVVTDAATDPRITEVDQSAYAMTSIRGAICVPIMKLGTFVAAMAVHTASPRHWTADDVELVQQVTSRCWESIERVRLTQSLRESEHLFRALANSIPNLAWMATPDGLLYWYNDQWYAYTGTTPEEMKGWGWERVHDPEVLPTVRQRWMASIELGVPFDMVFPLRSGSGEFRRFLTRVNPVRDSEGHVTHWFGTNTDVEDERRAVEANALLRQREQELRAQAEAANLAKDEFLAMLGHELRNPLSPILTALQLMKLRGDPSSAREQVVIERQVNHLTRLIDDLLDVSRIARGMVELKQEPIELAEVVARAVEMASPLLEQRSHVLEVGVPRHLVVFADSMRLGQVVSNLLTNAAKYTNPGGRISVTGSEEEDAITLRVRDTGIGIAPDVLPRVFERFVQERQAIDRAQGGLGLGLTIVQSLVERHGGTVSASSEGPDQGSEFAIRLPKWAPAAGRQPSPPAAAAAAAPAGSSRRILVVDDNEDGAEMLAAVLAAQGHDTRVAHDGPEALRMAGHFKPEVAFLDIGLPVMDGYELAARLRDLPELGGIRLIAVTGYGQESDRQRTRAAGFQHHLVKPVDLDAVNAVVDEAV
ncbi:MAG: ATP-binding protein [Acidobacteriota bacterium]